ncbi:gamma-glutamyltransferase [Nostoc sp. 'Peltigera malacea cyanobiont' DB3992]|uniref:gamma-glutamyltransferase n=1 Tax=Nostoc sp. 'Peltigera malacea cyanobiont' DB3992 TaxID=1206980 RepID=UPI000C0471B1|nr:gamma-glutamyltransferase [Nostoc sp. 'Peltigera malacea cyanobiont' DB3992]PHM09659.1 gamma-glutamyltransferase [Nostoc sp. 'Peltigera malacea cyanobiont' DB3992]
MTTASKFVLSTCLLPLTLSATLLPAIIGKAQNPPPPEAGSGRVEREAVRTNKYVVVAANPLASAAGRDVLRRGGSAIDAAIAVQMVLTLVEPQSSGIGGGAFLVYYDAKTKKLVTFDGRETAPAAAKPDRFLDANGKPLQFYDAVVGGKSVGVPGVLRMLELAHKKYGKLPWDQLFQGAIQLSEQGFPLSPRLYTLLSKDLYLSRNEPAKSYFYQSDGTPKPIGTRLVNQPLAEVLRQIAKGGANAFYQGNIAKDVVATVKQAAVPGDLTTTDLVQYQAKLREPVCGTYRIYKVCGMGPPSSGGLTVLQILGILQQFNLPALKPASLEAVHLFSEAGRLAYADRNLYIADTDFVPVPVKELINPNYLKLRAAIINPERSIGQAQAGNPLLQQANLLGKDQSKDLPSTSHVSIVDAAGNAISMTTSIEDAFGSRLMVRGFLLNNQLTDFSFLPTSEGKPVANRIEAKKRPRSSMAPMMVFDRNGKLVMVIGSAGGPQIINYVAKAIVGHLDWGLDIQRSLALPNFGSRNGPTELEANTDVANLKPALEAKGHTVSVIQLTSGSTGIVLTNQGLVSGADPRREGAPLGE